MAKKDDGVKGKTSSMTKKPIQLGEVKVTAARMKPSDNLQKSKSSKADSVDVGYGTGSYKRYSTKDIKEIVKKGNLKSIDTTSKRSIQNTVYGKKELIQGNEGFLNKNKTLSLAKSKK